MIGELLSGPERKGDRLWKFQELDYQSLRSTITLKLFRNRFEKCPIRATIISRPSSLKKKHEILSAASYPARRIDKISVKMRLAFGLILPYKS